MQSKYMSVAEASDYLRCSAATLRRWARDGKLSRVRLSGRKLLYIRAEVERLAEQSTYVISSRGVG